MLARFTSCCWRSWSTNCGLKARVSVELLGAEARKYMSAGRMVSSHCVTEPLKLETITVKATANAKLATTPLMATVPA